jgi:hypothetical protein
MSRKQFFSSEFLEQVIPGTHLFGDFVVTDGEDDDETDVLVSPGDTLDDPLLSRNVAHSA